jgi:hypothetical protein
MAGHDGESTEAADGKVLKPAPVTPAADTEKPEGLAFDVEKGADLSGVPVGDQSPKHPGAAHTEEVVRETGDGVGLAVPGDRTSEKAAKPIGEEDGER